jgi:hypothetical protein
MTKTLLKVICCLSLITVVHAETLFSPGSITIATNQTILITTLGGESYEETYLDGQPLFFEGRSVSSAGTPYAIAGNHTLTLSNYIGSSFITYQLLNGSSIKTIVLNNSFTNNGGTFFNGTNSIYIPAGKTAQFFAPIADSDFSALILPDGSTNVYNLFSFAQEWQPSYSGPAVTGPVTIQFSITNSDYADVVSYYFTDEILQLPPQGFLNVPAPVLEVDVQKSYNLTDWTNVGAFNTSAEAKAFYRLQILQ